MYENFRRFAFPFLGKTKNEMAEIAQLHGFANLMEKTWFCHHPDRKGRPCGLCNPCVYTIQEGLARRVPTTSRLRGTILSLLRMRPKKYGPVDPRRREKTIVPVQPLGG
jgi:hypothetical protein